MTEYLPAPDQDVVVSTRVRLARNFADLPFVHRMDDVQAEVCIDRVSDVITGGRDGDAYRIYRMIEESDDRKQALSEHRLISNELMRMRDHGAAAISSGRNISIMINEDDHMRIQTMLPALQVERCAELAFGIDDEFGRRFQLAFDSQLGYLTSCPTDIGTGMRISAVLHLPALTAAKQIGPVMQTVGRLGLSLRGFYGEGSDARGHMYILSNQASLGRSEDDMIRSVSAAAGEIVGHERQMRENAEKTDMLALQDKLMRSLGEIMNARIMTAREMTRRLSDVRYAASMGYVHAPIGALDEMMMDLQPGSLAAYAERPLNDREKDVLRAELMRSRIKELSKAD